MNPYSALIADLFREHGKLRMDGNHVYWREDSAGKRQRVPNVTTIIKTLDAPQLDNWKVKVQTEGTAKTCWLHRPSADEPVESYVARTLKLSKEQYEHERLASEAAKVGTEVHALIEHACRLMLGEETVEPRVSDEAISRFGGWQDWAKTTDFKPLVVETKVYHPEHNYCGTLDLLAEVGGKPAVLDWKSQSKGVYESHRLQSAAYRKALEALGWPPLDGYIVGVPGDGQPVKMSKLGPAEDDWDAFRACLLLYRWVAKQRKAA